jgi:hypothetical protein
VAPQHGARSQGEADRRVQLGRIVSAVTFHWRPSNHTDLPQAHVLLVSLD